MKALGKISLAAGLALVGGGLGYFVYERTTEQPRFRVIIADGAFEVRDYPPLLMAETVHAGSRRDALKRGFRELADYIFAKSRGGEKIAMTAPVVQDRQRIAMTAPVIEDEVQDGTWRTRFVMPAKYDLQTLPNPPAGVTLSKIPARRIAAIRFSGNANDGALSARQAELREWIGAEKLEPIGPAEYAFYNSPFIPPFMRRNEILIPIASQ